MSARALRLIAQALGVVSLVLIGALLVGVVVLEVDAVIHIVDNIEKVRHGLR